MELTKFSHACLRVTDGDRRLVLDPGVFSEVAEALTDIDAALITHQHADHVDAKKLAAAAEANPRLRIWAPKDVVDELSGSEALSDRLTAVGPGESFMAGGLPVRTFGGQHALIHSSIPVVSNVGYLISDGIYHPGDSYVVPNASVQALLVPINAPWAKVSETADFVVAVRAPRAFQIHDALISEIGTGGYEGMLNRVIEPYGVTRFQHLSPTESVTL